LLCVDDAGDQDVDVMEAEEAYIQAFELVATYTLIGEELVLSGDGVELRYERSAGD
jgi:heat shock protein HslJ